MGNPPSRDASLPDHVGAALGAAAGDIARRAGASRSIARIVEPNTLPTVVLEERRLIHREESVRRQADAFREIRTRLLALGGDQNFITMVAPISPRSGGSFVARNLAAAFAFDEAKTALLIDCNLRHPSQHVELRVDTTNGGLIDYLDHPSLGVEKILYHTGIPRLRLIPSGREREIGGEYFSSFRMRAMLDSLRSRYSDRYIFLDGPAAKDSPDARILADLVDFVVLVAGSGRDTPSAIQKVVANFDPSKLAGIVLNELP
ncbi:MAG: CpsD/CapB family tyrosine-protein kinase [Dokdonella sp.]|uniref:CpsD/CapB family tyrosine-protein kinase n=1 Tax=Dokdonella sp. TaxID=2291710 RepID=UPI002BC99F10|nr:CpsD/CapB family tyrosine-protein kinase [Dokdonella sp.]HOX72382.1 CpsD/CapB family tyrosine-protein kinase [Dokdonella sp.]HPG93847.1 CpsD/CapB family tyrosine-protein kinase [Dokdonella sp.]HPN80305.1 CpsD/CapB family tyrosine-protein kinase [Dokdonella sp.]